MLELQKERKNERKRGKTTAIVVSSIRTLDWMIFWDLVCLEEVFFLGVSEMFWDYRKKIHDSPFVKV